MIAITELIAIGESWFYHAGTRKQVCAAIVLPIASVLAINMRGK